MSVDLHQIAALRVVGDRQRYTSLRRQLVEMLSSAEHPITIPDILRLDPELAQSSVYRNLAVLEQAGVITRVVTHDEWARFELAEDIGGHHHHLICEQCGTVLDVVVPDTVEATLDESLASLAAMNGFELRHHRLDLVGVCTECRA
ncbi:MAG: Fe2+/Zn2+ uptake regulation protein [Acidimicrobiales bacterium]|jgi:Fur family ferric uptake transcriptional regulator|nr:Fe2+/Zn2+ uptake regulation protein [Acidimicrobiales bacterium]